MANNKKFRVKNGLTSPDAEIAGALTANTIVASGITYPSADGSNGQVIATDGSGSLSFIDLPSGVEISNTVPSNPSPADLWWDSSDGVLKIYYDDGDTQQWVDASPTLSNDFVQQNSVTILTPTGITPASNTEFEPDTTFTLTSSDYDFDGPAGSHESSDWQVSLDPAFGNTVVESLNDTTNLTSYEVTGGISTQDTFYWRVRHRDSNGNVSNYSTPIEFDVVLPPPELGESYCGGIYMGDICAASSCYRLIVAPNATGCACCALKTESTSTAGTSSLVDGYNNTYGPMDNATHPAGNWCATRTINGFSDWYLPAVDELETFYNNGATGSNESVIGSGEAFVSSNYWSSTEFSGSGYFGCSLCFFYGTKYGFGKINSLPVRAVRREPI